MTKYIAITVVLLALFGCGRENPMDDQSSTPEESPGVGLRKMALSTPPSKLGFISDAEFPKVYGVLTDWNIGDNTATIMSMRDGTASLYTTSSFGIIGGQGHEKVRQAAKRYVKLAEQYEESAELVTDFPYPKTGQVFYYILMYDGVYLVIGNESEIDQGKDHTRPLFAAAQEVLTELRHTTESENAQQNIQD